MNATERWDDAELDVADLDSCLVEKAGSLQRDAIPAIAVCGSPKTTRQTAIYMEKKRAAPIAVAEDDLEKCYLHVSGMTCSSCVAIIEGRLLKVQGI